MGGIKLAFSITQTNSSDETAHHRYIPDELTPDADLNSDNFCWAWASMGRALRFSIL
jgi:hypothetical protein